MKGNVFRFRTLKHGDPERKFQMILDDPPQRIVSGGALFHGLVAAAIVIGYIIVSVALGS